MFRPSRKGLVLIILVSALAGGGLYYGLETRNDIQTDAAAIEAHIIPIAPKVAGYVATLAIQDNQHVRKGDVLLTIDRRDYEIALEQAKADLAAAEARLLAARHNFSSTAVSAPSNLDSAKAEVAAAAAEWKNARLTLDRLQKLDDTSRSRQTLDNAIAVEKQARSALENAQSRLKSAETAPDAIAASEAAVTELAAAATRARATLQRAQNDLDDTIVRAPQDGRITRRNVEQGAYVQPGQQLTALVGDDVWVIANYKETQLEHIRPGQPVDIEIDAFPDRVFKGRVDSIQSGTGARFSLFPPENATGNFVKIVQRVPVKITFDTPPDPQLAIGPGMSAVPTVHVK